MLVDYILMGAGTKLIVLGSGQDGGIPHAGCYCRACERARENKDCRRLAPSIAVYDERAGFCYLIDASPDLQPQIDMIHAEIHHVSRRGKVPISGILLTHAHIGHYTGLLLLGREVLGEKDVPVCCTRRMKEFLSLSRPFSLLVENRNISLQEVKLGRALVLDGAAFTPVGVPHRAEITDAVGYVIEADKRVIYVPDTDRWTDGLTAQIAKSDIGLVDGTFYSRDEVPWFENVPHPPIEETLRALRGLDTEIYFTHINHTNPANADGPEKDCIENRGFKLAHDGLVLDI
jgi:pyrroloquinoline quinone biosynthesis protein B